MKHSDPISDKIYDSLQTCVKETISKTIVNRSRVELETLCWQIIGGSICTSQTIDSVSEMQMVFPVTAFGGTEFATWALSNNVAMMYAFMLDGYDTGQHLPTFISGIEYLNAHDTGIVCARMQELCIERDHCLALAEGIDRSNAETEKSVA